MICHKTRSLKMQNPSWNLSTVPLRNWWYRETSTSNDTELGLDKHTTPQWIMKDPGIVNRLYKCCYIIFLLKTLTKNRLLRKMGWFKSSRTTIIYTNLVKHITIYHNPFCLWVLLAGRPMFWPSSPCFPRSCDKIGQVEDVEGHGGLANREQHASNLQKQSTTGI